MTLFITRGHYNYKNMAVRFMVDSSEGKDGACEAIMDFVVSWTLRRAQNECKDEPGKEQLYIYARRFLGMLIHQEIKHEDIVYVETWKQEHKIDLWVRAVVNGVTHDILIEDKYYSSLHDEQCERYKVIFDNWLNENLKESIRHYAILTCRDKWETDDYKGHGYEIFAWDDMVEAMCGDEAELKPTGSDIFDEFWIEWPKSY